MASCGRRARLRECLALGDEAQKNSRYSAAAYHTGDIHGGPAEVVEEVAGGCEGIEPHP
jgi:hypothetical protein